MSDVMFISGIGGVGMGPLALLAHDAGYTIVGSDPSQSDMRAKIVARQIEVSDDQSGGFLRRAHEKQPITCYVHTAALPAGHPEIQAAQSLGIPVVKRDELLRRIITEKNLRLIAVAGTHGKTTTTGMIIWLARYFGVPVSYSIGTTLSWAPSGHYSQGSEYFIYECDEFDRNFLAFHPSIALITSIEYDHPDTYASPDDYMAAFRQFAEQSERVIMWQKDAQHASIAPTVACTKSSPYLQLKGEHNRRNASLVLAALELFGIAPKFAAAGLNTFAGTGRRFERLEENLYSDYGHTPTEIQATLQLASELSEDIVLVYQPHQNIRQHEIRTDYSAAIFEKASSVYWLPTYQSREDPSLSILTPTELSDQLPENKRHIAELDDALWHTIREYQRMNKLVLLMGAGNIDSWARAHLKT